MQEAIKVNVFSNPLPPDRVWGVLCAPPAVFGAELRPPKGFQLLASCDTIILLIMDCHATIGAKTPSTLRTPILPPG